MKPNVLMLLSICLLPLSVQADCLSSIKNDLYDKIWTACTQDKGDILFMVDSKGKHEFGTYDKPSAAAMELMLKAEQGDSLHQYFWSEVLALYSMEKSYENSNNAVAIARDLKIKSDAVLKQAAEGGAIPALYKSIVRFNTNANPTADEKATAIRYAELLRDNGEAGAEKLLQKVNQKSVGNSAITSYENALQDYKALDDTALLKVADASRTGSLMVEVDTGVVVLTRRATVEKNETKSREIYHFLVRERNNAEAGYILARWLGKNDKPQALELYEFAANNGQPDAAAWLGEYYACNNDKAKALQWLAKATQLGFKDSEYIIGEIEELGKPTSCSGSWVSN